MAMGTQKLQVKYQSAMVIAEALQERLAPLCQPDRCVIAGSLRRKKKEVGDIEIVCIPRFDMAVPPGQLIPVNMNLVIHHIRHNDIRMKPDSRAYTINKGGDRYYQVQFCGMPCDIFMTNEKQWGRMLAIRTGPAEYSIKLASRCNDLGYKGHKGELVSLDGNRTKPSFPTEKSFYEFLGWDYPEPENRE